MKYKGNEKLIGYVMTYGPKGTRSPPKRYSLPKFKKKTQLPENIPLQNSPAPSPLISRGFIPCNGSMKP